MFWKPKFKFKIEHPSITDEFPIYPAKQYKRKWVKNCANAYRKYKQVSDGRATTITAAKCPGIRDIMESGYILQTWYDFTIETTKDDHQIYYPSKFQSDYLDKIGYTHPLIKTFNTKESPMRIPVGANHHLIFKYYIPGAIEFPKGYSLLLLPIAYDDNPVFSACPGRLTRYESDFNIHLFWHTVEGRVTVRAGTPLCQLIPIKDDNIPIETIDATDKDIRKATAKCLQKQNRFSF